VYGNPEPPPTVQRWEPGIGDCIADAWYKIIGLFGSIPAPTGVLCIRANLGADYYFCIHYGDPSQTGYYWLYNIDCIAFKYMSAAKFRRIINTPPCF
jgi:hypothetical protein